MNDLSHIFIADKEKAHTDSNGMDLLKLIASYQPATTEQLQHNETLPNLHQLLGNDKLIYIHDDIQVDNTPQASMFLPTIA